jgi:hypothetical protein
MNSGWSGTGDDVAILARDSLPNAVARMRYYFHLKTAAEVIPDEHGIEAASADHAYSEALWAIRETRRQEPGWAREWAGWTLDVADGAGNVLAVIKLDTPVSDAEAP